MSEQLPLLRGLWKTYKKCPRVVGSLLPLGLFNILDNSSRINSRVHNTDRAFRALYLS